jgi:membrane-associated PAP2 superfamily phosphatase
MSVQPQSTNVTAPPKRRWPRWARRGLMEGIAIGLIALGVGMMVQPFFIEIYSWSFTTVLVGTAMFTIVSKFPE